MIKCFSTETSDFVERNMIWVIKSSGKKCTTIHKYSVLSFRAAQVPFPVQAYETKALFTYLSLNFDTLKYRAVGVRNSNDS